MASADPESPEPSVQPTVDPSVPATMAPVAPGQHQVTYTITTTSDLTANIYYVSADPPNQGAANDPSTCRRPAPRLGRAPHGPTPQRWLTRPNGPLSAQAVDFANPEFHCEIAVDGQVIASEQGGSGVRSGLVLVAAPGEPVRSGLGREHFGQAVVEPGFGGRVCCMDR